MFHLFQRGSENSHLNNEFTDTVNLMTDEEILVTWTFDEKVISRKW